MNRIIKGTVHEQNRLLKGTVHEQNSLRFYNCGNIEIKIRNFDTFKERFATSLFQLFKNEK